MNEPVMTRHDNEGKTWNLLPSLSSMSIGYFDKEEWLEIYGSLTLDFRVDTLEIKIYDPPRNYVELRQRWDRDRRLIRAQLI